MMRAKIADLLVNEDRLERETARRLYAVPPDRSLFAISADCIEQLTDTLHAALGAIEHGVTDGPRMALIAKVRTVLQETEIDL